MTEEKEKDHYLVILDDEMWPIVHEAVNEYSMSLYNKREEVRRHNRERLDRTSFGTSMDELYTKKLLICGEILNRLLRAGVPLYG